MILVPQANEPDGTTALLPTDTRTNLTSKISRHSKKSNERQLMKSVSQENCIIFEKLKDNPSIFSLKKSETESDEESLMDIDTQEQKSIPNPSKIECSKLPLAIIKAKRVSFSESIELNLHFLHKKETHKPLKMILPMFREEHQAVTALLETQVDLIPKNQKFKLKTKQRKSK